MSYGCKDKKYFANNYRFCEFLSLFASFIEKSWDSQRLTKRTCFISKRSASRYGGRIRLRPLNPDDDVTELTPDKAYKTVGVFKCVL